jgi:thiamine biosynthesis lipoprotein
MGTLYSIEAYGADTGALQRTLEEALDEVDRIDRLMSHYKPDSALSRLNRDAARGPVVVEPELFDLIAEAVRHSRDSDGAFDITVGPLMKAWGFFRGEGRVPRERELANARRRIGYQHLVLNAAERSVRFAREGMELDLGGIAKGYAVDRVVALLRARGVGVALVSAGGSTIYGLGAPPEHNDGWPVQVQDPVHARRVALTVTLKDRALSISGGSEKAFEAGGVRYAHIMDPRTGQPSRGVLGVAVLTGSGIEGDALDNALFVQGIAKGRAYLETLPGTEAIFFLPAPANSWTIVHAGR